MSHDYSGSLGIRESAFVLVGGTRPNLRTTFVLRFDDYRTAVIDKTLAMMRCDLYPFNA